MGTWGDIYHAGQKYLVDYNPANPAAYYNIGKDAVSGNYDPRTKTSGIDAKDAVKGMDPANPYKTLEAALGQAATDSKALAALQWQRQMEGLGKALGFVSHSQGAFDNVYGHAPAAPGSTLPQGLGAQIPQGGQGMQSGVGLGAYLNGSRQPMAPAQQQPVIPPGTAARSGRGHI